MYLGHTRTSGVAILSQAAVSIHQGETVLTRTGGEFQRQRPDHGVERAVDDGRERPPGAGRWAAMPEVKVMLPGPLIRCAATPAASIGPVILERTARIIWSSVRPTTWP
jgi:hypothetical protein